MQICIWRSKSKNESLGFKFKWISSKIVKSDFDHSSKSETKNSYEYHRLEQGLRTARADGKNLKPISDEGKLEFYSYDDERNMTPKTELYVYGVAAMYRKFDVEIAQPEEMEFKNADGTTRSEIPASVTLPQWQKTRYTNQTYCPRYKSIIGRKDKRYNQRLENICRRQEF